MMSGVAYQFPDHRGFESKRDYLATKEIFVDFWISKLRLEHKLECKFGRELEAAKRREMSNRLTHLRRLRQLIRSRNRQRVRPRV